MLAVLENVTDQIEVLVFLVRKGVVGAARSRACICLCHCSSLIQQESVHSVLYSYATVDANTKRGSRAGYCA